LGGIKVFAPLLKAAFAAIESTFVETLVAQAIGAELFRRRNPNRPATAGRSWQAIAANFRRRY
jgi:hypothetical protein